MMAMRGRQMAIAESRAEEPHFHFSHRFVFRVIAAVPSTLHPQLLHR